MSTAPEGVFSTTVPTPMVYVALAKPKPYIDPKTKKERGEPKFQATFLLPADHPELKPIKDLAIKIARAAWQDVDLKSVIWPFKSGSEYAAKRDAEGKKNNEIFAGKVMLKASSKFQPRLSGTENGQFCDYEGASLEKALPKFFAGAEVLFQANLVANEVDGKRSVTAYLNMIYSTGNGKRVGGGRPASEVFKGYAGHTTEENPTAGDTEDELY
jgi:hypothetical protein